MDKTFISRDIGKLAFFTVVASIAVFCYAALTMAETSRQGQWPCKEDLVKYCSDVQPRGNWIGECLNKYENDLSATCKEHLTQVKKRSMEIQAACKDDNQRLCKDVQPGGGRLMKCLKAHDAELSPACREKLPKGRKGK